VSGILKNVCVLRTAFDAIQNDFCSVIISDASACHRSDIHEKTLQVYDRLVLAPLFRILTSHEIIDEVSRIDSLSNR